MFDCVLPTRNARNGWLFTRHGDVRIRNARHRSDVAPRRRDVRRATRAAISRAATCITCSGSTRSSARVSRRFTTCHYYMTLMAELRGAIAAGDVATYATAFRAARAGLLE